MGWLPISVAAATAFYFYRSSDSVLMWLAIAAGLVSAWSFGVMHNQAVEVAKRRPSYRGGFSDFTNAEADSVSDTVASINIGAAAAIAILTVVAIVRFM